MGNLTTVLRTWLAGLWEPSIGLAVVVAFGIRLVLIPWFSDPYDFWAGYLSSRVLSAGWNPFSLFAMDPRFQQLGPWPYPAEYFLVALSAFFGSAGTSALYPVLVRIPSVAADAGTGILIFRIAKHLGSPDHQARTAAYAYLLNPFAIIVSAIWGVNDPIPVFLSVLGLYFLIRPSDRHVLLGSFVLGLGIATKLYPVLLVPIALALASGFLRKVKVLAVAAIAPLVTSLPFLLSDARAYVGTAFGFAGGTSGLNRGQLDPQFTSWLFLDYVVGPLDSRLAFVALAGLAIGLLGAYRFVQTHRLDAISATSFVVLFAFLLAVRWSPNYLLWAVPFVTLFAIRSLSGWYRWLALGFWVPALAHVLIYNGWFADPFSGGSGFSYWALIPWVPESRVFEAVPNWVGPALLLATVISAAVVVLMLFRHPAIGVSLPDEPASGNRPFHPQPSIRRPARVRIVGLVLSLLFVGAFVASTAYQLGHARAVSPSDFAKFDVLSDGSFSMRDEFRADILSFYWVFHGTGRYSLHPNGTSGILLDTIDSNGTAQIELLTVAERVTAQVTFRVDSLYGPQSLGILGLNSSELQVAPNGTGWTLRYVDQADNLTRDLGPISSSWQQATVRTSSAGQEIEALGTRVVLPPQARIGPVWIGHTHLVGGSGGRFQVSEVVLQWVAAPNGLSPLPASPVILLDAAVLAPMILSPQLFRARGRSEPVE